MFYTILEYNLLHLFFINKGSLSIYLSS